MGQPAAQNLQIPVSTAVLALLPLPRLAVVFGQSIDSSGKDAEYPLRVLIGRNLWKRHTSEGFKFTLEPGDIPLGYILTFVFAAHPHDNFIAVGKNVFYFILHRLGLHLMKGFDIEQPRNKTSDVGCHAYQ